MDDEEFQALIDRIKEAQNVSGATRRWHFRHQAALQLVYAAWDLVGTIENVDAAKEQIRLALEAIQEYLK